MIDEQTAGVRRFLEVWGDRSTVVTMSAAQRRILRQAGMRVASADPKTLRNFAQQTIALLQDSQRRDELGRSAWLKAQA